MPRGRRNEASEGHVPSKYRQTTRYFAFWLRKALRAVTKMDEVSYDMYNHTHN